MRVIQMDTSADNSFKRRQKARPMPAVLGVGTVSVIFIFLLLCLVTFAILAYSSAASDERLSKKAAERSAAYYEASNRAQQRMGQIDELLETKYRQEKSRQAYLDEAASALETKYDGEDIAFAVSGEQGHITVSWREHVSEGQALAVCLDISYPQHQEAFYKLEQYQVISTGDWHGDTSMKVYGADKGDEVEEMKR